MRSFRVGLGPVFVYEWLTASRRWQMYAGRVAFVILLFLALLFVWLSKVGFQPLTNRQLQADIGEYFFYAVIGTQLAVILLAAPAATAGAICLDKTRGALLHLMVTDLSDAEIILGKIGARLVPVFALVACGAPVLFGCTLLGGIEPSALVGAYLVTASAAVLGCSLALLLSVWGTKTHEVLLIAYLLGIVGLLAYPIWVTAHYTYDFIPAPGQWVLGTNPFVAAFAPYLQPGRDFLWEQLLYLGVTIGLSAFLVGVAIWRLRKAVLAQAGRPSNPKQGIHRKIELPQVSRWLPGPSLDRHPLLWREWHRRQASGWAAVAWAIYLGSTIISSVFLAGWILTQNFQHFQWAEFAAALNAGQVFVGLLLLCVSAVSCLAEERGRQSLDALLTTPLSTRAIVWGKWLGAYRSAFLIALLAGLPAAALASQTGEWRLVALVIGLTLAYGAFFASLGLALATWVVRFSRAVVACLTVYALLSIGTYFVILLFYTWREAELLLIASPLYGLSKTTALFEHYRVRSYGLHSVSEFVDAGCIWIGGYSIAAFVLLVKTEGTFERCLGRITKRKASGVQPAANRLSLASDIQSREE